MSLFGKNPTESTGAKTKAAKVKKATKVQKDESGLAVAKKPETKKAEAKKGGMKDLYKDQNVAEEKKAGKSPTKPGDAYRILVKPMITEKAANLGTQNKYVFEVSINANKIQIAKAVNEVYGIEPEAVNIINVSGKKVRYGRHMGQKRDTRKAIVTLPEGKTINIYEGV